MVPKEALEENANYYKNQIKRMIQPQEWPVSTNIPVNFSVPFRPSIYTYMDYMSAWVYAIYFRPYSHSWFIQFLPSSKKFPYGSMDDGRNLVLLQKYFQKNLEGFYLIYSKTTNAIHIFTHTHTHTNTCSHTCEKIPCNYL